MKKFFSFLALVVTLTTARGAAPATGADVPHPLERDLGRGLVYHRAANLPADLPTSAAPDKRTHILDLRFAQGDATAAAALLDWLKRHATPRTPVFVLANAKTKSQLLARLAGHDPAGGILLLGPEAPDFSADIALKVSAADDQRAYDAFTALTSISSLLTDNPDKPRNDEARLTKDHSAVESASPAETPDGTADEPAPAKPAPATTPPPPPVIDVVLQRAVHLHRALLALKKL